MRGLQPPPKEDTPSRLIARMFALVVMVFVVGVVIWAAVTNQRIPLVEDRPLDSFELDDVEVSEGVSFHISEEGSGGTPVFLFHDANVAGMAMFETLVDSIDGGAHTIAIDLPGFGFSSRFPSSGIIHTVRDMAERLAPVIEARSEGPVIVAGVGLGGEVAAELAATRPELVAGLVMIDVDFYGGNGWVQTFETWPFIGRAVTYAFEVSGPFAESARAPYCEEGGWCLSNSQKLVWERVTEVAGTTYSLHGFRDTPPASNVPSLLVDISAPTLVVWSEKGPVPRDSVDRVLDAIPDARLQSFDVFQSIHERSDRLADLIMEMAG